MYIYIHVQLLLIYTSKYDTLLFISWCTDTTLKLSTHIEVDSQIFSSENPRCEEEIIDDGRVEGTMIYLPPEVIQLKDGNQSTHN